MTVAMWVAQQPKRWHTEEVNKHTMAPAVKT